MRDFWEDRYRGGANVYGEEANLFLRQHVQKSFHAAIFYAPAMGMVAMDFGLPGRVLRLPVSIIPIQQERGSDKRQMNCGLT
jgi:hypothetical protein